MGDDIDRRVDAWFRRCPNPETAPLQGMAETGLLRPAASWHDIARTKAAIVARTGLLGVAGIWGGRQQVARHFVEGFGSAAQQATWLGRALAVAISEPRVGAHPKLLTTRAEAVPGGFRISGEKAWVSNGPDAEAIIVFAISAEVDGRKRYSAFLVPRDTPGLTMEDMPGFHALRPSRHCHLQLNACNVPADAMLGPAGSAYETMALPFRDIEDAVGTFSTLGALRFLLRRFAAAGARDEAANLSLGALIALTSVHAAGAQAVVAALDSGGLDGAAATLVGLRVLAADILERARAHYATHGVADDTVAGTMFADLDASLSVARGPRMARQARLGEAMRDLA
jgi:acyl-CoA dehydrogenase